MENALQKQLGRYAQQSLLVIVDVLRFLRCVWCRLFCAIYLSGCEPLQTAVWPKTRCDQMARPALVVVRHDICTATASVDGRKQKEESHWLLNTASKKNTNMGTTIVVAASMAQALSAKGAKNAHLPCSSKGAYTIMARLLRRVARENWMPLPQRSLLAVMALTPMSHRCSPGGW